MLDGAHGTFVLQTYLAPSPDQARRRLLTCIRITAILWQAMLSSTCATAKMMV